jgi:hypothetical protein
LGAALLDDSLDLSAYYRPSALRYRAGGSALLEHAAGARAWWALGPTLDVNLSADLVTSAGIDVLLLYSGLAWRPRF